MSDFDQTGLPPVLTPKTSVVDEVTIESLEANEKTLNAINNRLGFISGMLSKVENAFTSDETEEDALFQQNTKAFETLTNKIRPTRTDLLNSGVQGTAAVYLGEKLGDMQETLEDDKKEGILSKLGGLLRGGLAGAGGFLGKILGGKMMRLGGLAAFGALKWEDITEGLKMFQEGNFLKGIETVLIGNPDNITLDNATQGVVKQAGAWAGMGMAIGGPVGAIVGGLLGGLAKTIQTGIQTTRQAYEEGWDQNLEEIHRTNLESFAEAEGIREKMKAMSKMTWQSIGSVFAGAKRSAEEAEAEGRSKFVGWFQGLGNTFQKLRMAGMPPEEAEKWKEMKDLKREQRRAWVKRVGGFFGNIGEYGSDLFQKVRQQGLRGIGQTKLADSIREGMGKVWDNLSNSWSNFQTFLDDKGITDFINSKLQAAKDLFNKLWNGIKGVWDSISSFLKGLVQNIGLTIKTKWKSIFGSGFEAISDVITATGEGQIGGDQMIMRLSGIKEFREWAEQTSGQDFFGLGGRIKSGMATQLGQFVANNMNDLVNMVQSESVEDFIITRDGKVIKTNPQDTIFGTKAFDDGTMSQVLNSSQASTQVENQMLSVLQSMNQKLGNGRTGNIVQNNFTSRFNPENIIQSGMVEVY